MNTIIEMSGMDSNSQGAQDAKGTVRELLLNKEIDYEKFKKYGEREK